MQARHFQAARVSRNFGVVPLNRKRDWSIAKHAEIVAIVRVFRDPLPGKHQVASKGLLQADVKFIAESGIQRIGLKGARHGRRTGKERTQNRVAAPDAGKYQIFIKRRFQRARVRRAKNRARLLDVVRKSDARLGLAGDRKAVVDIPAQANVHRPVPDRDCILNVESKLLYVRVAFEQIRSASAGQIVRSQNRIVVRIKGSPGRVGGNVFLKAKPGALRGIGKTQHRNIGGRGRRQRYAGRVVGGVDNPNTVILVQERLFVSSASLNVVDPFDIGNVGSNPRVGQRPILTHRLPLQARWPQVGERIVARIIVVIVTANKSS